MRATVLLLLAACSHTEPEVVLVDAAEPLGASPGQVVEHTHWAMRLDAIHGICTAVGDSGLERCCKGPREAQVCQTGKPW